jgi:hypothetical protein
MTGSPGDGGGRDILFEFTQIGPQVRVAAIDAVTGAEAIVIGPANAARTDLKRLAARKLARLLNALENAPQNAPEQDHEDRPQGRGRLV